MEFCVFFFFFLVETECEKKRQVHLRAGVRVLVYVMQLKY